MKIENKDEIKLLINELITNINNKYVFPEKVNDITSKLEAKYAAGGYSDISDYSILANAITDDLQSFANDFHFYCEYNPKKASNPNFFTEEGDPEEEEQWITNMKYLNFDIPKVERLPGNIGYIKLNSFMPAENAGNLIWAAFTFLINTNALIIDIRYNGGGSETMVQFLLSYLTKRQNSIHLKSFYERSTDSQQQSWTFPFVPGNKYTKPIYVLVSRRSASAAEAFAYDIKHFELGTLVGEKTRGAANTIGGFPIIKKFVLDIPTGRPIHSKTKDNWEGKGVIPHIEVEQNQALEKAHLLAINESLKTEEDTENKRMLEFELDYLITFYKKKLTLLNQLSEFVGNYGNYMIIKEEKELYFGYKNIKRLLITSDQRRFYTDETMRIELTKEENDNIYLSLSFRDFKGIRKLKKKIV